MADGTLTFDLLHSLFQYDAETGKLYSRVSRGTTVRQGDEISPNALNRGYKVLSINGKQYKQHRVIWFMCHGAWPVGHIDHIDRNKTNNCLANLRDVSRSKNMRNCVGTDRGTFATLYKGRWDAKIRVNGKKCHVGRFDTQEEATAAAVRFRNEQEK